jgi:hypothetical protein
MPQSDIGFLAKTMPMEYIGIRGLNSDIFRQNPLRTWTNEADYLECRIELLAWHCFASWEGIVGRRFTVSSWGALGEKLDYQPVELRQKL